MPISTTAPPGEWPEHHTDYSQTIWILCVLSAMMLIVIVVVVINRQSLCRWINIHYQQVYNDPGPTRDTQPIEEKNPDDRYTELVPSGHWLRLVYNILLSVTDAIICTTDPGLYRSVLCKHDLLMIPRCYYSVSDLIRYVVSFMIYTSLEINYLKMCLSYTVTSLFVFVYNL